MNNVKCKCVGSVFRLMAIFIAFKDLETLKSLKDRFPQSPTMYVCNKVDTTREAQEFDNSEDEEDGNDDDENGNGRHTVSKGEKVFNQLKRRGLVSDDSWETCPLFHAISAKEVREERLERRPSKATERFNTFESNLQHLFKTVVKTHTRRVVQKLLVLQETFVNAVHVQRTLITEKANVLPEIIKKGNEIEMKMFESLSELTFSSEEAKRMIVEKIKCLKEEFLHEAEVYKVPNQRRLKRSAQTMLKSDLSSLPRNDTVSLRNFDFVLERFLSDMRGSILEKMCNSLTICVELAMKDLVNDITKAVIDFNEDLTDPIVSRILEESYDIQFLAVKAGTDEMLQIVLNGLLDSIKEAVCVVLRREISGPLSGKRLSTYSKKDVDNKENRRSIVNSLLKTIDETHVAQSVHEACFSRLQKMHELFEVAMASLESLQTDFAKCQIASRLEEFDVNFTPQIRTLAVEGMALQNMQNRGPVGLGAWIANTRHGVIYDCVSERWCKVSPRKQCAVKVLKKGDLGEEIWNQTAVDLVNTM